MTQTADHTTPETALSGVRETVALAHPPSPGVLRMTGEDALDLLDRLSTNDVDERAVGFGLSTVLTTNKGRVVDLLTLLYLPDHWLLLTSPGQQQKVIDWIDAFTFGEEIELEDISDEKALLTLVGPAAELLGSVVQADVSALPHCHFIEADISGVDALVWKTEPGPVEAFNILGPADSVSTLRSRLLNEGRLHGIREMNADGYEALRISAGIPVHGPELGEEVNPLEAGLWHAVSFTKGCYVGQEVVARLNTYEKVKRYLTMLSLEEGPVPDAGTPLTVGGKDAGALTSVSLLVVSGRRAALGYVRKKYALAGVTLTAETVDGPVSCEFMGRAGRGAEG